MLVSHDFNRVSGSERAVNFCFIRVLATRQYSTRIQKFTIARYFHTINSLSSFPFPATKEQTDSRANKRQRVHDPAISPVLAAGNERDEREREFIDDRLKSIVH